MDESVGIDVRVLCRGVRKTDREKKGETWPLTTETKRSAVLLHSAGMQSKDALDLSRPRAEGVPAVSTSFSSRHWLRAVPWAELKCVNSPTFVLLYTCTQNNSLQRKLSAKSSRYLPSEVICTAIMSTKGLKMEKFLLLLLGTSTAMMMVMISIELPSSLRNRS